MRSIIGRVGAAARGLAMLTPAAALVVAATADAEGRAWWLAWATVALVATGLAWVVGRRLPVSGMGLGVALTGLLPLYGVELPRPAWCHLALCACWLALAALVARDLAVWGHLRRLRAARRWVKRIRDKSDWPLLSADIRALPEVRALREAIWDDALPAVHLLDEPNRQIRLAALAAMEGRATWQRGQVERVLKVAQTADDPPTRAAALRALAWVDDPRVLDQIMYRLSDPAPDVRAAALEALLCNPDARWPVARAAIHAAASDVRFANDGPLPWYGTSLPDAALADLLAWVAEGGAAGHRAAATLTKHYRQTLSSGNAADAVADLSRRVRDPRAPAVFRMEAAGLLNACRALTPDLLSHLLGPAEPTPLRLMAADQLLAGGGRPESAVAVLREIARQPNRELALATAAIVQRHLGIDLGLPRNAPAPPPHSREAAEVTRRVMAWAARDMAGASPQSSMASMGSIPGIPLKRTEITGVSPPPAPPAPGGPDVPPANWEW